MEKINVLAVWQNLKALIEQAESYAAKNYSSIKDQTGISKIMSDLGDESDESTEKKEIGLTTRNVPKEILNAISSDFNKILDFISMYMIHNDGAVVYGYIMSELEMGINFNQRGIIDVDVRSKPCRLLYNPFFIKQYTINELIGATINEIIKIIYMHPSAYAQLNREKNQDTHIKLDVASSSASTELVLHDTVLDGARNRVKLNDEIITKSDFEHMIADETGGRSLEGHQSIEYYYKVADAYLKKQTGSGNGSKNNKLSGIGQGNGNNGNSQQIATPDNSQGQQTHNWEGTTQDTEENFKSIIKNAYDNLSEEQRGLVPAGVRQQIELLFKKPELNWKDILKKFVGIIPAGHKKSRMRLNRRQQDRFDLSGQLSDKVVRLVIAIDTSGSMSDDVIEYCMNEIYNIVKIYKTDITVIECDAEIGRVYNVKSPKDIKPSVTGRGGTSYIPVIEYLNSHRFRDAVMIYFTDGYGDYEIPRPRTYRNLWVVTESSSHLSLKEPFGEVKALVGDKKYRNKFKNV